MNEKKTKPRYWLALMLKELEEGQTFTPAELHITVIPWFVVDKDEEQVVEKFRSEFKNLPPFSVTVGEVRLFGPKRDVRVQVVKAGSELYGLHQRALQWFVQIDARWAVKSPHVGDEYIPHVRRRVGSRFNQGDRIDINSLSLIKAARQEDGQRTVAAKTEFSQ